MSLPASATPGAPPRRDDRTPAAGHDRIAGLDGVRGAAMVMVILAHCVHVDDALPARAWIDDLWNTAANYCWAGLDGFFVLSGFLITGILLRNRGEPGYFVNFYVRRALRILPLYYLFIVPMLFVFDRPDAPAGMVVSYLTYWHNLYFAWNGVIDFDQARQVTWSLAVEEQFYLVWPAVVLLLPLRGLRVLCGVLIVAALALRLWLLSRVPAGDVIAALQTDIAVYMATPCRVDSLAAGALLATGLRVPTVAARVAALAMLALIPGLIWIQGHGRPVGHPVMTLGCTANIVFAVAMIVLAMRGGLVERICRWPLLQACGKYSYAMFLTHLLVLEVLRPWCWQRQAAGQPPEGPLPDLVRAVGFQLPAYLLFAAATTAIALAIGWTSWHLFEKRVLTLKRFFPSR